MLHQGKDDPGLQLQQVEINTIAASFSSLSGLVAQLHRYAAMVFNSNCSLIYMEKIFASTDAFFQ
jgi:hypothetical protein